MSLFQEYIDKHKEYRVLYFEKGFYPVELLSQENKFSTIDSRGKVNDSDEIRIQKSEIPNSLKEKLIILMSNLGLNIGCIDIVEDINNEFYFLEVNPVGQISGYSFRGNLNFEKIIVEKMISIDNELNKI